MKYLKAFLVLAVFLLIFTACENPNPVEPIDDDDYTIEAFSSHYKVGNRWETEVTEWDNNDTTVYISTSTVIGSYEWEGNTVWKVRGSRSEPELSTTVWSVITNSECLVYLCEPPCDQYYYYRTLREPFEVGQKWVFMLWPDTLVQMYPEWVQSMGTIWVEIEAKNVTCEVPAGTFENCLQTRMYAELNGEYYGECYRSWIAPGVGCVLSRNDDPDRGLDIKLLSYNLK